MSIVILFSVFLGLAILSVPISISVGIAVLLSIFYSDIVTLSFFIRGMTNSANSFLLTAIPFFTFAGIIMAKSGISAGLFDVAKTWVGRLKGGILMVTVLSCMAFGAISGSTYATVVAIGVIALPELYKTGMSKGAAAALIATAGCCGIMIPPSMALIVFGALNKISVSALFIAEIIPGLIVSTLFLIYSYLYGKKHNIYSEKSYSMKEKIFVIWKNRYALIMPFIILGGIYSGIVTPTEAAIVSVIYGLCYGFLKKNDKLKIKDIMPMLKTSCITTAAIMFILATSSGFGKILALEELPSKMANFLLASVESKAVITVTLNLIVAVLGTFLDGAATNIILGPILLNIAVPYGIDPLHFGVMFAFNLVLGLLTPPLGANLFIACQISGAKFDDIVKNIFPWIVCMIIGLTIIIIFPQLSTWLPGLLMK